MSVVSPGPSSAGNDAVSQALVRLDAIDLSMVKRKLCESEEGPHWPRHTANEIEVEYLRYLALCATYPDRRIVPCKLVDRFWHQHILDTQVYAGHCQAVLGRFLHHYPYFGMNGPEDKAALASAFAETLALYESHFGTPSHLWMRAEADCNDEPAPTPTECFGQGPGQGGCLGRSA